MRTASIISLGAITVGCEGRFAAGIVCLTQQGSAGFWRTDHVGSDAQEQDHLKALPWVVIIQISQ